ncbi:MAG: amidohydrolase [Chloroflexi bacterium]|nr:amidohydrolase [Chloroflexota bacterium]
MIIDCRCRPPTKPFLAIFKSRLFNFVIGRAGPLPLSRSFIDESMELFFKEMDEAGVTKGVITGRDMSVGSIPNDHIAELVSHHPDRLIGIAGVDPQKPLENVFPEMERAIKVLKLKGINLEPGAASPPLRFNDRRLYPIYAKCAELGVPVFLLTGPFCGPELEFTHPNVIEQVAADFRNTNFVCSHGCYPYVMEMIGVAMRRRNVFVSPDLYVFHPGGNLYLEAANGSLQDQLLFATAYPLAPLKESVEVVKKFHFRDGILEKTLYKNAQRLLGV